MMERVAGRQKFSHDRFVSGLFCHVSMIAKISQTSWIISSFIASVLFLTDLAFINATFVYQSLPTIWQVDSFTWTMLLLLRPRWWKVGLMPGRRPITGRIVRWRLQLRPALHPRVTAQIPLSFIASNKGCGSLPPLAAALLQSNSSRRV